MDVLTQEIGSALDALVNLTEKNTQQFLLQYVTSAHPQHLSQFTTFHLVGSVTDQ